MNLAVHEAAALFPMLNDTELDELAADIAKHGLVEPIVMFDGKILDGRNRFEACRRAHIEPKTRVLTECMSPTAFVVSANLHRRHLTVAQRAAYAGDPAVIARFRAEAKARQRDHAGTAPGKATNTSHQAGGKCSHAGEATKEAASAFKAGRQSTEIMASLAERAPDVFEATKRGAIPTVADAVRIGKLEPVARAAVLKGLEAGTDVRSALADQVRAERIERITRISHGNAPLTGELGRFPVIYADPPWRYEHVKTESRAIENEYPTMSLEEICALPVRDIATDDSILFLWTTSPKLAEAMRVIEAWGFEFRTCAAWVKDKMGMGYYFRQRHELLLVAARGSLPVPLPEHRHDSVIEAPLGAHSAKPEIFAELIEEMYPEHKRIELFCRSPRPGWSAWGNQAEGES